MTDLLPPSKNSRSSVFITISRPFYQNTYSFRSTNGIFKSGLYTKIGIGSAPSVWPLFPIVFKRDLLGAKGVCLVLMMARGGLAGSWLINIAGIGAIAVGALIALLARTVTVEDLGAFEWYWVLVVGLTLAMVGGAIFIGARRYSREPQDLRSFFAIVLSSVILIFLGLVMLIYTSPMVLEGIGGIRGFWLGLVGMLLLFLGLLALFIISANRKARRSLGRLGPYGLICDVAIMAEGAGLMGFAGTLVWNGDFSFGAGYVALAGAQLAIIGALLGMMPFLHSLRPGWKWLDKMSLSLGTIIALEGLLVVALSDVVQLGPYIYSMGFVVLCGAQLSALAAISIFCLAFSPIGGARMQSRAFLVSMLILLATPILAVLLHL